MRKSDFSEWRWLMIILALTLALMVVLSGGAWASNCPPNTRPLAPLKEYMERSHGEHPRIMGWMHGKTMIIYTHPETRAWTAFVIDETMTCAAPVASGVAWTEMDLPPAGDPS